MNALSAAPVVFLHAFPLNGSMWTDQRSALGSRETLAPDFPGFGGRPPGEADLEAFAGVALAEMDAAGIDEAVVVGLSMGGYVAFRLHALAPERILGLILADTRSGPDDEEARLKRTDQAARVRREGLDWLAEARRMAAELPDSRLVVLPGSGHLSNLETPKAFNEALLGFLP